MYGDINGGGAKRRVVGSADFYKHVPKEMTEATKIGAVMSLLSVLLMILLFVCETYAFAKTNIVSSIEIDANAEQTIALNFNVSLYDLHCDFVSVDVWDTLGTNLQNVTKDVIKWNLDSRGEIKMFHGRNTRQKAIQHEVHREEVREALGETEARAAVLDGESAKEFVARGEGAFVDYYAPWCIWCQRLEPTWELFARKISSESVPVGVGKVDCVAHAQLCKDERILAFPTLRWYERGKAVAPDYGGDRTVEALLDYAKKRVGNGGGRGDGRRHDDDDAVDAGEAHHPGCMVAGRIMVNRVPGNFHIQAKSINHEFHSATTNLTHRVNDLTFGSKEGPPGHLLHNIPYFNAIPAKYKKHTNPLHDKMFLNAEFHQAFHHHLKIVSTHLHEMAGFGGPFFAKESVLYQILEQSQLVLYEEMNVPEIRFTFDLSPMSVNVSREGRRWYEYATTLLAIIGGTYTTLGLINATLLKIFKPKKL